MDSTEGKILATVCGLGILIFFGWVMFHTLKGDNSDLDPQCLEENKRILRDPRSMPFDKQKRTKNCREELLRKQRERNNS